jgi:hypothetical protein
MDILNILVPSVTVFAETKNSFRMCIGSRGYQNCALPTPGSPSVSLEYGASHEVNSYAFVAFYSFYQRIVRAGTGERAADGFRVILLRAALSATKGLPLKVQDLPTQVLRV